MTSSEGTFVPNIPAVSGASSASGALSLLWIGLATARSLAALTDTGGSEGRKTFGDASVTGTHTEHKCQTPRHDEDFLTPVEVAETLTVPERTLADWRYKQTGPPYLKVGKHVRYTWGDLRRWCASQQG